MGVNSRDNAVVRSEKRTRLRQTTPLRETAKSGRIRGRRGRQGLLSNHLFDGRRSPQDRVASANRSVSRLASATVRPHDHITVF